MDNTKRIASIDFARALAIIFVILTHVTESTYDLGGNYLVTAPIHNTIAGLAFHSLGRMGVPIFFFLSGYLLLDRNYDHDKMLRFYKRNMLGLFRVTEVWIIVYFFFSKILYSQKLAFPELIEELLFFRKAETNHLWYMGTILGIYLVLPLLANILKNIDKKIFVFVLLVSSAYVFILPTVNVFRKLLKVDDLASQLSVGFSGGWAGILVIVGWMIKKGYFEKIRTKWLLPLSLVFYLLTVLLEVVAYRHGVKYTVWYDSILVDSASLFLTIYILRIRRNQFPKLVSWIGYSSFAVYLIHNVFRQEIAKYINDNALLASHIQKEVVLFILTLVLSEIVVYILSRNKKIANGLFFMRLCLSTRK